MKTVRPKKHLGQHFLKDRNISKKIANSLTGHGNYKALIEIGPGTGVLTEFLVQKEYDPLILVELDGESIEVLRDKYSSTKVQILHQNFLKLDPGTFKSEPTGIIGNFPYNISSQIFFWILKQHHLIQEVVCMLQKEVAERICSPHGNKTYGKLSVLIGAYYHTEILFKVPPHVFYPPPKVESAVIRLQRNTIRNLPCNEQLFEIIVKQGFQNRRKTLRNALKPINLPVELNEEPLLNQRAEQLSVAEFILLTQKAQKHWTT